MRARDIYEARSLSLAEITRRTSPALACVPEAIPLSERPGHFALLTRLFGEAARERRDVPNGYAFRFDAEVFDDIARFVALERLCCPFLAFVIELAPDGGPLWLSMTGPARTREFLDLELPGPSPSRSLGDRVVIATRGA